MEKLREKTFGTIFLIISLFILSIIIFFNVQNYHKEYNNIKNNLIRMDEFIINNPAPNDRKNENNKIPNDLNNRIIMDYNFYTIILNKDNNIVDTISHNENSFSVNIIDKASEIIASNDKSRIKINFLYFSKLSYNFNSGNFLIVVDTTNVQHRLLSIFISSLIFLIIFEILTYFITKKITNWIIKPVEETFDKQKTFIADASHELKTPLAIIMASVDCLSISNKNKKWINNIKTESDKMNHLISKLLDLSKSEYKINKELYIKQNISKIIEKKILIFESLAYEKKINIENNIQKNVMLYCNLNDIEDLMEILIDNAIKHSYENSVIKINLYEEKNNIILDVINKGDAIPKSEQDKIFERFYRCDKSRNRDSNRYGLGLSIAKNIVRNYDGDIKVFCENSYTTFKVILKMKKH